MGIDSERLKLQRKMLDEVIEKLSDAYLIEFRRRQCLVNKARNDMSDIPNESIPLYQSIQSSNKQLDKLNTTSLVVGTFIGIVSFFLKDILAMLLGLLAVLAVYFDTLIKIKFWCVSANQKFELLSNKMEDARLILEDCGVYGLLSEDNIETDAAILRGLDKIDDTFFWNIGATLKQTQK